MGNGRLERVHTELHRTLSRALDLRPVSRDELPIEALDRAALGSLLATNRWLQPEMVGALGLIELQAGPRCRKVVRALERLGCDWDALDFYAEHAEADPRHGKDWVDNVITSLQDDQHWATGIVRGARWRSAVNAHFFRATEQAGRAIAAYRLDVLPAHVQPMLATAGGLPIEQDRWAFEMKWDGIRALTYWDGAKIHAESRNLRDITASWPELNGLGPSLGNRELILDGEMVALDDRGVPSFQRLQERMHVRNPTQELVNKVPAAYFVFDVLVLDGTSVMERPWTERRDVLGDLDVNGPCWATPPAFVGEGDATIAAAEQRSLEGVVAKRLDSPYVPGQRSRHWIKIKRQTREEFIVGGWTAGEGRRAGTIGSLALGLPAPGGGLRYVGNVGTGFTDRELRRLESVLHPIATDENPFTQNVQLLKKGTVFVEPRLVTDVEYTERTTEGILRHPSYKGERIDKSPADVKTDHAEQER